MFLAHVAGDPSQLEGWSPHFDVWIAMLIPVLVYGTLIANRVRSQKKSGSNERIVSGWQIASFLTGMGLLWYVSDYPIHEIAEEYLLSVHMVQHTVYTILAPPLILAGLPVWMIDAALVQPKRVYRIAKRVLHPVVAAAVFNVVLLASHWPVVVNKALEDHPVHLFMHVTLVVTALMMWFCVINRHPALPRLSGPLKLVYLFVQSLIPTVPAAFITFAERPVYDFYARAPRFITGFTAVEDQQLAGAIMKVGGGALIWLAIVILFFRWYATEHKADEIERKRNSLRAVKNQA